jgi:chromosome segregation protein
MKLKSIHIAGFKSFAERVSIHYHAGITGVIGPNGSGKSNIIDAVRWVMGEQTSKSLRAEDPTDIIFSGSQNKKPLSLAEVTLVFSNDGGQCPAEFLHLPEVSIGRSVNRGGERDYFMNREPCRLKDIVDFLFSLGLGSKSYAIIQQDKRDRIIHASPEDLREVLEETAGITLFKIKRKEAEKRLLSTAERLKNLKEIEFELFRQKESLEHQVEKAKQKLSYLEELKETEISLIKNHVGFYKNLSTKIQKEIQTQSDEILISSKDAAQWESTANDLKSYELELVQRIKQWERERDDQTISFTKYQERMENYDRLRQDRSLQKDRFEKELLQEQSNLKREQERQHTIAIDMEQLSVQWDQKETEQEALQTKLEILDESLQVERLRGEELRSEMRALESGQGALRAQNEAILNTMTRDQHHVQKIEQQLVKQRELRAQINADRSALVEQLKKISADLDLVQVSRMEAQTLWHQIQFQYEQALEEKELMKTDFLEKSTVALGLQKLVDSQGMLSDGSLALKEQLSRHIVGFLFEEVSLHEEDEVLLEHCLPTLFQSALVENRDHFVKIIDKAQELSVSRVSFFVTDLLEPLSPLEQQDRAHLLELAGVRCVGNRLEKLTKPFLKNIFDRIFICQDEWLLFEAKKRARKNSQFVLITERGTVHVNPFGFSYGIFLQESAEKLSFLQYRRQYTQALQEKETSQEKLAFSEGVVYNISQNKFQ